MHDIVRDFAISRCEDLRALQGRVIEAVLASRPEPHGCATHPPERYSATGGALGRASVRFARPNAPHTRQNRQKLGFCAPPPKPAWVPDSTSASWHQRLLGAIPR